MMFKTGNLKSSKFVTDVSYTFIANVVSSVVSALSVIILPKLLGVADYGYWQLYLLFSVYVSLLHFGLSDGYYLRYSGIDKEDQDKSMFKSLFFFLAVFVLIITILVALIFSQTSIYAADINKQFVFYATLLCANFIVLRAFVQFGWQTVRMFKQNAVIIILERILFIVGATAILIWGNANFTTLIIFDVVVKFASLLIALFMARDVMVAKLAPLKSTITEALKNMSAGLRVMLAGVTSSLIIGVIQFIIQGKWNIETYSKVALTLTLSNLMMVFINAVAVALLPQIRRLRLEQGKVTYESLLQVLAVPLVLFLNIYYPLIIVVGKWLPAYSESLPYMALLFPICLYECKTALVTNTYLKALRMEQELLFINVAMLIFSSVFAGLAAFVFENLTLTVLCILLTLAIRSLISEYIVSKRLSVEFFRGAAVQIIITISFVIFQFIYGGLPGAVLFLAISLLYAAFNMNRFKSSLKNLYLLVVVDEGHSSYKSV